MKSYSSHEIAMRIDSPEFHQIFTPQLRELAHLFERNGYELRIAGGAVRDLLMKKQPQDVDFATTATPEQMKDMFTRENIRMINSKGEKHGTITARMHDKENFEITTLRIDRTTDGRHAEVEFTTDWRTDAERRDLTINSMFLGLDGTLYDFFSGRSDLERCHIAFVGDAATRIREDYLRILRYFRFYGRIARESNAHDADTLKAIKENGPGLGKISGERIWMELKKILAGNFAAELIHCIYDLDLPQYIGLPPGSDLRELHEVSRRSQPLHPHPVTLLSSLFKDENDVLAMEQRMKVSTEERKTALFVVQERGRKPHNKPLKPYQDIIVCSKEKNIVKYVEEVLKYQGESQLLTDLRAWDTAKFPVTGKDLLGVGVPKGKGFGAVLDEVRQWWLDSDFKATREELLERLQETRQESGKGNS
ncbi:CCA tRNA nucleotidyltransferase 1, mitochondrial-like [Diadema antillarum]|uniref:CCA tRNA nucleotidyltransferase 1, mitochondrial-like n=1 Tax=Diadema antillarum TaxID=105358 RepID=UPI003A85096F